MNTEWKIGDKAQYKVRPYGEKWVNCVIGEKELEEIKKGIGFFDYRKPKSKI